MRSWMIGLLVGILPLGWLPVLPPPFFPFFLLPLSLLMLVARGRISLLLAGLLFGGAWGLLRGQWMLDSRLTEACNGSAVAFSGYVRSLPRTSFLDDGTRRQRFEFQLAGPGALPPACGSPSRLLLSYYGDATIRPGQHWLFEARMKKPWGLANPGSFNMQSWFARTGIDGVGTVREGSARYLGNASTPMTCIHSQRQRISAAIEALPLRAESRAVLRAVTVADRSGIDSRLWELFQYFGINHLLVVSGLHVGLLAGAGYLLGGLLSRVLQFARGTALWPGPVTALVLAFMYTALAGVSVPTQRALCMLSCFLLAGLLGRRSTARHNLLLAAVVVLLINPLEGLGSGFWLSFGAVGALLWLGLWQTGRHWAWRSLACHGFLSLVMLPLGGWWFGGASLISAPANLIMVPLVGLYVVPLALLGVVFSSLGWPVAEQLWLSAAAPIEYLLPAAQAIKASPVQWLYLHRIAGISGLFLALVAVILCILPLPAHIRLLVPGLLLPLLVPWQIAAEDGPEVMRVAVLDVGQGTSIIVRSGDRALLYDTGGGDPAGANMARSVVLPYLRRYGISRLDTLVISHGDRDHSAGMASILNEMPVARFRHGPSVESTDQGHPCRAGEAWRWPGGQRLQFLSPAPGEGLSKNNGSCVLRIDTGGQVVIIPGDIDSERERELVRYWGEVLNGDWLHLAHHGSATSSSRTWIRRVSPELAVISSGNASRFGHPHPGVLAGLDQADVPHWWTAREGALEFVFRPERTIEVSRYRVEHRRFWM